MPAGLRAGGQEREACDVREEAGEEGGVYPCYSKDCLSESVCAGSSWGPVCGRSHLVWALVPWKCTSLQKYCSVTYAHQYDGVHQREAFGGKKE